MKTSIIYEDGMMQLALTGETPWEVDAECVFNKSENKEVQILMGQYYDCEGGWTRQGGGQQSLILRIEKPVMPKE